MSLRAGLLAFVLSVLATAACGRAPSEPGPDADAEEDRAAAPPPADGRATVVGVAPPANGPFASVVLLEPYEAASPPPPPEEPAVLDQYGAMFQPPVLLVRVGQPVEIRNSEDVAHNVHVVDLASGETVFNIGMPTRGAYPYRFDRPGIYDVSCDIHPAMAAFLVVVETPYAALAERDGSFRIEGVPFGRYRLRVWNIEPSRRLERDVLVDAPSVELRVDGSL